MDINSTESCTIKSEIILTETFCGNYEDCGNEELKTEPVDYKELFMCKGEDDPAEHMDTSTAPIQQCSGNECNFTTIEKDSLQGHLKTTKYIIYFYCGNEELKTEPVDYKELFMCKGEDDPAEHMDTSTAPIQQCSGNECNFTTIEKDSLQGHLKTTKYIIYFCKYCNFKAHLECFIKKHLKIHKGIDDTYITKDSNFKTPQSFSSATRVKKSRSADEYICNECNFTTLNTNSLRRHMTIHIGDEYKCEGCDYKTVWKDCLKEHVKTHTGDEYKCRECDYKTAWKGNLKTHIKIHTGDEYKCKQCDYKTVRESSLKEHVRIHTGEVYKCQDCDYKTLQRYRLKEHVKIHTGEEYKCKECDYKALQKYRLKEHVRIHTGEAYKCKDCDYKTFQKYRLNEHVQIHTGEEYKCKNCDYKTVHKKRLKGHVKIHRGEEYKCKECDYKTAWKGNLKKHIKTHTSDE
ncbi:hypothetical protein FQA39_LY05566 [Lamprigera yunnana]|nr:hypothetical protein FQA39_LY05566 [Lamprigera yunnana]